MVKRIFQVVITLICFFISTMYTQAQDYKYEIGGMAGTSFYMGDANKTKLFKNIGPSGGAVFRYNHDFRWSVKTNLAMGHVSGDTRTSGDAFPYGQGIKFSRNFVDVGGQVEFNFFNYSNKYAYLDTKRLTPYVLIGLGFTVGFGDHTFYGVNVPMGVGLKYKLNDRLNLGFEFSMRKLFGDDFDKTKKDGPTLSDPYKTNSGFFKNKDWYALTMFSITWDFGVRCAPCINN